MGLRPNPSSAVQDRGTPNAALSAVGPRHAAAHFSAGLRLLAFPFDGRRLIEFPPANLLHDAVAFALAFESSQGFLDGFPVSNFDKNHVDNTTFPVNRILLEIKEPRPALESRSRVLPLLRNENVRDQPGGQLSRRPPKK